MSSRTPFSNSQSPGRSSRGALAASDIQAARPVRSSLNTSLASQDSEEEGPSLAEGHAQTREMKRLQNKAAWKKYIDDKSTAVELKVVIARANLLQDENRIDYFKSISTDPATIIEKSKNRVRHKSEVPAQYERGNTSLNSSRGKSPDQSLGRLVPGTTTEGTAFSEIEKCLRITDMPNGYEKTQIVEAFKATLEDGDLQAFARSAEQYRLFKKLENERKLLQEQGKDFEKGKLERFRDTRSRIMKKRDIASLIALDKDGDGKITLDEILEYLSSTPFKTKETTLNSLREEVKQIQRNIELEEQSKLSPKEHGGRPSELISTLLSETRITMYEPNAEELAASRGATAAASVAASAPQSTRQSPLPRRRPLTADSFPQVTVEEKTPLAPTSDSRQRTSSVGAPLRRSHIRDEGPAAGPTPFDFRASVKAAAESGPARRDYFAMREIFNFQVQANETLKGLKRTWLELLIQENPGEIKLPDSSYPVTKGQPRYHEALERRFAQDDVIKMINDAIGNNPIHATRAAISDPARAYTYEYTGGEATAESVHRKLHEKLEAALKAQTRIKDKDAQYRVKDDSKDREIAAQGVRIAELQDQLAGLRDKLSALETENRQLKTARESALQAQRDAEDKLAQEKRAKEQADADRQRAQEALDALRARMKETEAALAQASQDAARNGKSAESNAGLLDELQRQLDQQKQKYEAQLKALKAAKESSERTLREQLTAVQAELTAAQARLAAQEQELEQLRQKNAEQSQTIIALRRELGAAQAANDQFKNQLRDIFIGVKRLAFNTFQTYHRVNENNNNNYYWSNTTPERLTSQEIFYPMNDWVMHENESDDKYAAFIEELAKLSSGRGQNDQLDKLSLTTVVTAIKFLEEFVTKINADRTIDPAIQTAITSLNRQLKVALDAMAAQRIQFLQAASERIQRSAQDAGEDRETQLQALNEIIHHIEQASQFFTNQETAAEMDGLRQLQIDEDTDIAGEIRHVVERSTLLLQIEIRELSEKDAVERAQFFAANEALARFRVNGQRSVATYMPVLEQLARFEDSMFLRQVRRVGPQASQDRERYERVNALLQELNQYAQGQEEDYQEQDFFRDTQFHVRFDEIAEDLPHQFQQFNEESLAEFEQVFAAQQSRILELEDEIRRLKQSRTLESNEVSHSIGPATYAGNTPLRYRRQEMSLFDELGQALDEDSQTDNAEDLRQFQALQAQLRKAQEEKEELELRLQEAVRRLGDVATLIETSSQTLEQQNESQQAQQEEYQQALQRQQAQVVQLQEKLSEREEASRLMQQQFTQSTERMREEGAQTMQKQREEYQGELRRMQEQHAAQLQEMEAVFGQERGRFESAIERSSRNAERLRGEIAQIQAQENELRLQYTAHIRAIAEQGEASTRQEAEERQRRIAEIEERYRAQIEQLTHSNEEARRELARATQRGLQLEELFDRRNREHQQQLEEINARNRQEYEVILQENEEYGQENSDLNQRIEQIEEEREADREVIEAREREIDKLRANMLRIQQEYIATQQELQERIAQLQEAQRRDGQSREQEIREITERFEADTRELREENDHHRREITNREIELHELKASMAEREELQQRLRQEYEEREESWHSESALLRQRIWELDQDRERFVQRAREMDLQLEELDLQQEERERYIAELRQDVEQRNDENQRLQAEQHENREKLQQDLVVIREHRLEIERVSLELQGIQREYAQAEAERDSLIEELDSARRSAERLTLEAAMLRRRIAIYSEHNAEGLRILNGGEPRMASGIDGQRPAGSGRDAYYYHDGETLHRIEKETEILPSIWTDVRRGVRRSDDEESRSSGSSSNSSQSGDDDSLGDEVRLGKSLDRLLPRIAGLYRRVLHYSTPQGQLDPRGDEFLEENLAELEQLLYVFFAENDFYVDDIARDVENRMASEGLDNRGRRVLVNNAEVGDDVDLLLQPHQRFNEAFLGHHFEEVDIGRRLRIVDYANDYLIGLARVLDVQLPVIYSEIGMPLPHRGNVPERPGVVLEQTGHIYDLASYGRARPQVVTPAVAAAATAPAATSPIHIENHINIDGYSDGERRRSRSEDRRPRGERGRPGQDLRDQNLRDQNLQHELEEFSRLRLEEEKLRRKIELERLRNKNRGQRDEAPYYYYGHELFPPQPRQRRREWEEQSDYSSDASSYVEPVTEWHRNQPQPQPRPTQTRPDFRTVMKNQSTNTNSVQNPEPNNARRPALRPTIHSALPPRLDITFSVDEDGNPYDIFARATTVMFKEEKISARSKFGDVLDQDFDDAINRLKEDQASANPRGNWKEHLGVSITKQRELMRAYLTASEKVLNFLIVCGVPSNSKEGERLAYQFIMSPRNITAPGSDLALQTQNKEMNKMLLTAAEKIAFLTVGCIGMDKNHDILNWRTDELIRDADDNIMIDPGFFRDAFAHFGQHYPEIPEVIKRDSRMFNELDRRIAKAASPSQVIRTMTRNTADYIHNIDVRHRPHAAPRPEDGYAIGGGNEYDNQLQ